MGQKEKLVARLKTRPKDFTLAEVETLLGYFSYTKSNKGKTSGSRIIFVANGRAPILLHKPHPGNTIPGYQLKQLIDKLEQEELL